MHITQAPMPPIAYWKDHPKPSQPSPPRDSLLLECADCLAGGLYRAVPALVGAAGLGLQGACWGSLVGHPLLGASIGAVTGGLAGLALGLVHQSLSEMD